LSKKPSNVFAEQFFAFAKGAGSNCRVRYAPTPSGFLHLGNAINFTLNWLVARLNNGHILLRIDDLDGERMRPEYFRDIFENLLWLGLDWDIGPRGPELEDFQKNWSQHTRIANYSSLLNELRRRGLVFACRKSRAELQPFRGIYPQAFRNQAIELDDVEVAWRLRTKNLGSLTDFVLRRRDGIPAYQLASVSDDLLFGITHIVRGEDLLPSTEAQRFLAECLDQQPFLNIKFLHHPLILDETGEKLSKSAGSLALKTLRESGVGPAVVFRKVAEMIDLQPADSAKDLLQLLSVKVQSDRY
jgi:glutamyl-tRNA synthetase